MRYNGVAVAVTKCMEGAERFLLCFKKEGSAGPGFWGDDRGFCGYFLLLACQRLRLWQANNKAPITNDLKAAQGNDAPKAPVRVRVRRTVDQIRRKEPGHRTMGPVAPPTERAARTICRCIVFAYILR